MVKEKEYNCGICVQMTFWRHEESHDGKYGFYNHNPCDKCILPLLLEALNKSQLKKEEK